MNMNQFKMFWLLLILVFSITGCYPITHGPWRGKVIDTETKEPIEGAAVVAIWETSHFSVGGPVERFYDARETMTDKDGNFEMKSYTYMNYFFVRGMVGPSFTIFKPGYGAFPINHVKPDRRWPEMFLNEGSVVELPKLTDRKERMNLLTDLSVLGTTYKRTPKFYDLLRMEDKNLGLSK